MEHVLFEILSRYFFRSGGNTLPTFYQTTWHHIPDDSDLIVIAPRIWFRIIPLGLKPLIVSSMSLLSNDAWNMFRYWFWSSDYLTLVIRQCGRKLPWRFEVGLISPYLSRGTEENHERPEGSLSPCRIQTLEYKVDAANGWRRRMCSPALLYYVAFPCKETKPRMLMYPIAFHPVSQASVT
jgi:hypothetical protein